MEALLIEATKYAPQVVCDPAKGSVQITGRSLLEDAEGFFQPIIKWLKEYINEPAEATVAEVKLDYYNTATSKCLYQFLIMLEQLKDRSEVKVIWYYENDDDVIEESGERIQSLLDVPVELVEF